MNAGRQLREYRTKTQRTADKNDRFALIQRNAASASSYTNNREAALDALREAIFWGYDNVEDLTQSIAFRTIRDEPEFAALVKQLQSARKTSSP